jgi:very-short-patch-repair endonuclease
MKKKLGNADYAYNLFKGAHRKQFEFARDLRKRQTDAEMLCWEFLRNRKLNGLKFRRQHPIDHYIADFYCHEVKLIIEVDGGIHNSLEHKKSDEYRDNQLLEKGITTLRFTNEELLHELPKVLKEIVDFINNRDK